VSIDLLIHLLEDIIHAEGFQGCDILLYLLLILCIFLLRGLLRGSSNRRLLFTLLITHLLLLKLSLIGELLLDQLQLVSFLEFFFANLEVLFAESFGHFSEGSHLVVDTTHQLAH